MSWQEWPLVARRWSFAKAGWDQRLTTHDKLWGIAYGDLVFDLHTNRTRRVFSFVEGCGVIERVSSDKSEDKPSEHESPEGKQRITEHAHPAQAVHQWRLHELSGARKPGAVFDRGPGLQQTHRQHADEDHERQADIERPECDRQRTVFPHQPGPQSTQTEKHQAQA